MFTSILRSPVWWTNRMEVVVCENYREAKDFWRADCEANEDRLLRKGVSNLELHLRDGTTRRYYPADRGIESLMGLDIDRYFNLIRDSERHYQFEDFLIHRVHRSTMWRVRRETERLRAREETGTWALIKEEWRVFLSSRSGRLAIALLGIMLTLFLLWLTAPRLP